jgi:hypothetical protein
MYDINEILAELQNGVSPDVIADKFTAALNEAITQSKAAEEAKRQEELTKRIREDKCADMTYIMDRVFDYLDRYFPSHGIDDFGPEDVERIVDLLDENLMDTIALVKEFEDIASTLSIQKDSKCAESKPAVKVVTRPLSRKDADSMINNFFHKYGLLQ